MWILLKIIIAIGAFVYRYMAKHIEFGNSDHVEETVDGQNVTLIPHKSKHGITATTVKIPFESQVIFKLSRETRFDKICKGLGISIEIQTGDKGFDDNVYISCDSSSFAAEVRQDLQTRNWIMALLSEKCESIICDGQDLRIRFDGNRMSHHDLHQKCVALARQMSELQSTSRKFLSDPFVIKALLIECTIWSIAGYAIVAFFEWSMNVNDLYVNLTPLLIRGSIVGFGMALLLVLAIMLFLSGSSRSHRIVTESFIVLCLSLPTFGVNAVSDYNIQLDTSAPEWSEHKIIKKERIYRKSRRSSYYTYHLDLAPAKNPLSTKIPNRITINRENFEQATENGTINIEVRQGKLNFPWYSSFKFSN